MKLLIAFLPCLLFGQITKFNGKPVTVDDKIALYEQWVKADPSNASNQNLLAAAYIQKTRETTDFAYLERASKLVDRNLAANQRDYEALRLRNLIELNRHHFAAVVDYARELTRSAPTDPQNWGSLGDALVEMGEYDEGRSAFEKMLALRTNLFSLNRMGYYKFLTGDIEGGIAMMKKAVDAGARYPENQAWCLVELGHMYFKTGHLNEAFEAYAQAAKVFPASHAAYAGLGSVEAARSQWKDAIASYRKAQAITPMVQYAGALFSLYERTGEKAEARKQADLLDLVAKLEEAANQKANRTLSLIYANQNRNLAKSLELAQADLEVRHDVHTWDALAWALYKNKRYDEARKAAAEAIKLNTPEPGFYYHAGMIALAAGHRDEGKTLLAKALALNVDFDAGQSEIARQALAAAR
jgi:tetratricopeptide (TPR) repeat protein